MDRWIKSALFYATMGSKISTIYATPHCIAQATLYSTNVEQPGKEEARAESVRTPDPTYFTGGDTPLKEKGVE